MRLPLTLLIGLALLGLVAAQTRASQAGCANGQCPTAPGMVASGEPIHSHAIVRITNLKAGSRSAGSGTLVDIDAQRGLIVTCAHLFRAGAGQIEVTFVSGQSYRAELLKLDSTADLAALAIAAPPIEPVTIATRFPRPGDPVVSCGFGGDGRLWCNRGQALGYVALEGGYGTETLELSGTARGGDSGGPIFDRDHELVAVLFGTNGRVVDGTFCGRIRQFLMGLSPRFRTPGPAPLGPPQNIQPPARPEQPLVQAPPAPPPDHLAKLEQLVSRLHQAWQTLNAKFDALAAAVEAARAASQAGGHAPPHVELPPGVDAVGHAVEPLEKIAEPWLSSKLAVLLVSLGVPGGIAGIAAGAAVWLVMRRGKRRLRAELDRLKAANPKAAPSSGADREEPAVVERHHNQFVAYETSLLDKAWAAAHAHVGEKYPGAIPYLKMVEGVKDQLLSGSDEPQSS